ncbi:MAG: hypothetical protein JEZ09_19755 [Salinivirgaceae bacterium]|nr:hypothetical protein [Salinivirgaceae bacterium]
MKTIKNQKLLFALVMMLSITLWACEKTTDVVDEVTENENTGDTLPDVSAYPIVETNQTAFYGNSTNINAPSASDAFYGQDAQYTGNESSYIDNENGTITDMVTGLMWQKSPDTDGDGDIDAADKLTYDEEVAGAAQCSYGEWELFGE